MYLPPGNQWGILKAWQGWIAERSEYAAFEEGAPVLMGDANADPKAHPALNAALLSLVASLGLGEIQPQDSIPHIRRPLSNRTLTELLRAATRAPNGRWKSIPLEDEATSGFDSSEPQ